MTAQQRVPDIPILRVNQIDAAKLDIEMTSMLREQLSKVFSLSQVCNYENLEDYLFARIVAYYVCNVIVVVCLCGQTASKQFAFSCCRHLSTLPPVYTVLIVLGFVASFEVDINQYCILLLLIVVEIVIYLVGCLLM